VALHAVDYRRTLAHVKHIGGFGQGYHGQRARRAGYDDALFADHIGAISETSVANIGFLFGEELVWPDAPALRGITMQLLEPRLAGAGIASQRAPVHLAELGSCAGAFVTNARGIAPVGRIDDLALPVAGVVLDRLERLYAQVPWDQFCAAN
jgi:branched-subunit amino acid aminotransferase/4-amino-4-deoxychorismate lyase